jgi:phospholipid/cholesterol/gamma-HCH transport system ATP-binding protein
MPAMREDHVEFERVTMAFGRRPIFEDLSCRFPRGRVSVVLGGSGSGKTTILRLIGGLVTPSAGGILVDGDDVAQLSERELFRVRRKLGMMFQGGALLDSMTVYDNLALPLREQGGRSEAEIAEEVRDRLEAVGLPDAEGLLPGQLSGGMVKRAALARAIIRRPTILLVDEPFSGLDPVSIRRIESVLLEVNRRSGITMVVVSHDVPSTMRMANWLMLLLPGRVAEGEPSALLHGADPEVTEFLAGDAA